MFCKLTEKNVKDFGRIVFEKIRVSPSSLSDIKEFSKSMYNELLSKRSLDEERALAFVSYIPYIIINYGALSTENAAYLRRNKVSLDELADLLTTFEDYKELSKYLDVKKGTKPIIVTTPTQLDVLKAIDKMTESLKVEMRGDVRYISGKPTIRVSDISTAGYKNPNAVTNDKSPSLLHGTTIDKIGKVIFEGGNVKYEDYEQFIDEEPFNKMVAAIKKKKKELDDDNAIIRTDVIVYDKESGISGEIDFLAVYPDGTIYIYDIKSGKGVLTSDEFKKNKLSVKTDKMIELKILSKWNDYATQGYLYGIILSKTLGVPVNKGTVIVGVPINYTEEYSNGLPTPTSRINHVGHLVSTYIPYSEIRDEYKNLSLVEIVNVSRRLIDEAFKTPKSAGKISKKKNFDHIVSREEKPLDRLKKIDEIAATEAELEKEIAWLRSTFGDKLIIQLSNVINSGRFGLFTTSGITLYKNASKGTGYHEGWHHFTQLYLTEDEKIDLYEGVRGDNIEFKTRDGRSLNTLSADHLDIEEFLADEFARYALDPKSYVYPKNNKKPKNIFQKIWEFLKRYFGIKARPVQLFQKLYTGKTHEYTPTVNNAFWGKLNSIAVNSAGEEIIPNERLPLYVQTFDYLVVDQLRKYNRTFNSFKSSVVLQRNVIDNVYTVLYNMYLDGNLTDQQSSEIERIIENKYDFVNIYLSSTDNSSLKGFTISEETMLSTIEELGEIDGLQVDTEEYEDSSLDEDGTTLSKLFDRTGADDSAFKLSSLALKSYFQGIAKVHSVDESGNIVYMLNELGVPVLNRYYNVFYRTKKVLEGAYSLDEMLNRISDKSNQRRFPELIIIEQDLKRIINSFDELPPKVRMQSFMFLQGFSHIMSMPQIDNMEVFINYNKINQDKRISSGTIVDYRRAYRKMALKIIDDWNKNFSTSVEGKSYTSFKSWDKDREKAKSIPVYVSERGKVYFNPFAEIGTIKDYFNVAEMKKFMVMLGIRLDDRIYEEFDNINLIRKFISSFLTNLESYREAKKAEYDNTVKSILADRGLSSGGIQNLEAHEIDEIAKGLFFTFPLRQFRSKRAYFVGDNKADIVYTAGMSGLYEEIADLQEQYGDMVSSGSFKIEDKTKYPFYLPFQLAQKAKLINDAATLSDLSAKPSTAHLDPSTNPWYKYSVFLNGMFENGGKRKKDISNKDVKIVVKDIVSIVEMRERTTLQSHPRKLQPQKKMLIDHITFFKAGEVEIRRAETSSTAFIVKLSDYGKGSLYPISGRRSSDSGIPGQFLKIMRGYLKAEVLKRKWFMDNEPDNKFASTFNIFEAMLSDDLKSKLVENINNDLSEELLSEFDKEVTTYFTKVINDHYVKLMKLPENDKAVLRDAAQIDQIGVIASQFILNHFILENEFNSLFFGDLYQFKNPVKRGKVVTNTGKSMSMDNTRNRLLNSLQFETLHSILTGNPVGGKDFSKIRTLTVSDVVLESKNLPFIEKGIIEIRKKYGVDVTEEMLKKIKDSLSGYKKVNAADGQGIINLDYYRALSIVMDNWDEKKEDEYKRQLAIFRLHLGHYYKKTPDGFVQLTGQDLIDAKSADQKLAKHRPFAIFNPYKLSYTGPANKQGPLSTVFDKFSVRPIIPEAAIGKRDWNLLLQMAKNDSDYLKFESGTKVYKGDTIEWVPKSEDGSINMSDFSIEEVTNEVHTELYSDYLKEQLLNEGIKNEGPLGVQFRKIVFGVTGSLPVKNNPELLEFFKKLEERFKSLTEELIKIERNELFNLLGLVKVDSGYKITNYEKFVKILNEESIRLGVPVNDISYIAYDKETNTILNPLDYAFNRKQIQNILSGIIDERLRRLKIHASDLTQVSSIGYETAGTLFRNPTEDEIKRYGTGGLHYYTYDSFRFPGSVSTMGVKVSMRKEFEPLMQLRMPGEGGEKIWNGNYNESVQRLNEAMRDEAWKKKHLKKLIIIGYRIPTQNNNFIERMEIMEFITGTAGSILIPAVEITTKSSTDFDLDKMKILLPSLDRRGNSTVRPPESIGEISNNISKLDHTERDSRRTIKEFNEILQQTDKNISKLIKLQREVRGILLEEGLKAKVFDEFDILDRFSEGDSELITPEEEDKHAISQFHRFFQFLNIDRQIEKMKTSYGVIEAEKAKVDTSWFQKRQDTKYAIVNEMIDTIGLAMSHPAYYEILVTPTSAKSMSDIVNELIAAEENLSDEEFEAQMVESEGKLYDKTKTPLDNSSYEHNMESHEQYNIRGGDLGGYAIQVPMSDQFTAVGFSINETYTVKDEEKRIYLPLIPKDKRGLVRQNGKILMHGDSVDGQHIKGSFDQMVSATVDMGNDPFYPKMGLTRYNKSHYIYLIHQKVPPKVALFFLQQPILKKLYALYEDKSRTVQGYTLKHAMVEMGLSLNILKNEPAFKNNSSIMKYEISHYEYVRAKYDIIGEKIDGTGEYKFDRTKANKRLPRPYIDFHKYLSEEDEFKIEDLESEIRSGNTSTALQKKVLSYFASITDESELLLKLQFANNADTNKYSTVTAISKYEINKKRVRDSGLFVEEQLDKLENDSMISIFDYTKIAIDIYRALFPDIYSRDTIPTFSNLIDNILGAKSYQVENISKNIESDYIEMIYKNFGRYNDQNLTERFLPLVYNIAAEGDHQYFSDKLYYILEKYPELKSIPFVAGLYEDVYIPPDTPIENSYFDMDNVEARNIFFSRHPDNPTFERNIYTSNWRELINFEPSKFSISRPFNEQQIREISEFFHELVYFSLFQGGATNTGNGFSDLIPHEVWTSFITDAFERFKSELEVNPSLMQLIMSEFEIRFKAMNPNVNWMTRYIEVDDLSSDKKKRVDISFFKNYYRGKDYSIGLSDGAEGSKSNPVVVSSDGTTPKKDEVKLEPGRYVRYKGDIYIVTKSLEGDIWQIYSPVKEGARSKLSVSKRNLEPMNDKAKFATYQNKEYMVTASRLIISMETFKKMNWDRNSPERIGILKQVITENIPGTRLDEIKDEEC